MKNFKSKLFFALALTIFSAGSIAAQISQAGDYPVYAPAVKDSEITYLDLIKKIFPDARIDAQIRDAANAEAIPLRHLFGKKSPQISGDRIILYISRRLETVDGAGGQILWLIIHAVRRDKDNPAASGSDWAKVLAAFRVSSTADAELIDAANVQTQNFTTFDEESPKLRISPRRDVVVVSNLANASFGNSEVSIIGVGKNGFDVLLNQFRMTTSYRCADWFNETASVRLSKNSVKGIRNVEITVKVEAGHGEADFAPVKYRRRFRYVFAWRLGKYAPIVKPDRARRAFLKPFKLCRQTKWRN